jgi:serine phosphatase RsbU (regulator of sigma subunit)
VPVADGDVRGGLLVSLHPGSDPDLTALRALATSTGAALVRAAQSAAQRWSVALVTDPLRAMPVAPPAWLRCAVTVQPATEDPSHPGGDVVVVLAGDSPDVGWLLVADVCGGGLAAATAAAQVRHIALAVVRDDMAPGGWLDAIDAALQRDPDADRFVTAVAVKLRRGDDEVELSVSCAGHPPALLSRGGEVVELGDASLPLNLRLPGVVRRAEQTSAIRMRGDDVLLLHTDGLVDRGNADRTDDLIELFSRAAALGDADAIVDALVSAMDEAVEPPRDDLAVAVVVLDRTDR